MLTNPLSYRIVLRFYLKPDELLVRQYLVYANNIMGFYLIKTNHIIISKNINETHSNIKGCFANSSWRRCICLQQNHPWYMWHLGRKLGTYTSFTGRLQSLILHPFKGLKVQTTSKGCQICKDKANCGNCMLAVWALGSLSSRASILLPNSTFCPHEQHSPLQMSSKCSGQRLFNQRVSEFLSNECFMKALQEWQQSSFQFTPFQSSNEGKNLCASHKDSGEKGKLDSF